MDNEKMLIEEIKVVQDIIKRMATHSFFIKGWTITVVVATLLLRFDGKNMLHILMALLPLVSFWYLDAYFLKQELLFREVHDWIRKNRLTSDEHLFDYNPSRFYDKVDSVCSLMFSQTLAYFYATIFMLIVITVLILYKK